jgi:hypothetical protein
MDPEDDDISPLCPLPFRFSALYNRYSAAYEVHQAGRGLGLARLFGRPVESTIAK